jgi:hypothetical protein
VFQSNARLGIARREWGEARVGILSSPCPIRTSKKRILDKRAGGLRETAPLKSLCPAVIYDCSTSSKFLFDLLAANH